MQLLPYLLTAGLFGQALAVSMSSRFTVSSTCSTSKVNDMLDETIDMVKVAIAGIDTLLNAGIRVKPTFATAEISALMNAARFVWGVQSPGTWATSLSADDTNQLKQAQGFWYIIRQDYTDMNAANYQKLYAALNSGTGMNPSENTLFCDDSTLKLTTKAADVFPGAAATQTVEQYFQAQGAKDLTLFKNGIWKDPDHKRQKNAYYNFFIDEYDGSPMCGSGAAEAITYWNSGNMLLCPKAFDSSNYKTSLSSMRTTTTEVTWNNVRSLPGIFLHEMMHFLDLKPHVIDEKVAGDNGKPISAYGLIACWMLSGQAGTKTVDKSKALTNADSYNVFATMAYLPSAQFVG
ncbi:hypothetical protein CJF32_00009866 [Rutstroemia sp. NJR-2017a WRK4]|nr:hypothetical protein CJF32_00009866 [Rutstroemia sp. NJR-2017a WRK4]